MKRKEFYLLTTLLIFVACCMLMGAGWQDPNLLSQGDALNVYTYSGTLNDNASINLPASSDGLGLVKCGATAECLFMVDIDGNVIIAASSDTVSAWDDNEHLCVYDGGDGFATVKNTAANNSKVRVIYYYK